MKSAQSFFAVGVGALALGLACSRQHEPEPMTPANATGEPRQLPASPSHDDSSASEPKDGDDSVFGPSETYPNPATTPPEEHPHHPGTDDGSGITPGAGPGTMGPPAGS